MVNLTEIFLINFLNLSTLYLKYRSVYIVIYYGFLLNIRNFGRQYLEENTIVAGKKMKGFYPP